MLCSERRGLAPADGRLIWDGSSGGLSRVTPALVSSRMDRGGGVAGKGRMIVSALKDLLLSAPHPSSTPSEPRVGDTGEACPPQPCLALRACSSLEPSDGCSTCLAAAVEMLLSGSLPPPELDLDLLRCSLAAWPSCCCRGSAAIAVSRKGIGDELRRRAVVMAMSPIESSLRCRGNDVVVGEGEARYWS